MGNAALADSRLAVSRPNSEKILHLLEWVEVAFSCDA